MLRTLIAAVITAFSLTAFAAVDANSASRAELESVKGIGPGLSGKIVQARDAAPFKNWPDMVDRVGGMGPGNAAKFSHAGLTVAGAAYAGDAATAATANRANAAPGQPKAPAKAATATRKATP